MPTRERADTGFSSRPTGCQPGAARLQKYLMAKFMLGNSGCWNPLSTMSSGGPSWHVYGKAIDLTANWNDPAARARGDAVFAWVLTHRDELNLQQMIWGNSIWDVSTGAVRTYAHDDHKNHVHVAIGYQASQDWQPVDAPAPAPQPPEDFDPMKTFAHAPGSDQWYYVTPDMEALAVSREEANYLLGLGAVKQDAVQQVSQAFLDRCIARTK